MSIHRIEQRFRHIALIKISKTEHQQSNISSRVLFMENSCDFFSVLRESWNFGYTAMFYKHLFIINDYFLSKNYLIN